MSVCVCVSECAHLTDVSVIKQNFRQSIKFADAQHRETAQSRQRKGAGPVEGEAEEQASYIFTTYKQSALAFYAFAFCCIKMERVLMQLLSAPSSTYSTLQPLGETGGEQLINTYEVFTWQAETLAKGSEVCIKVLLIRFALCERIARRALSAGEQAKQRERERRRQRQIEGELHK